MQTSHSPRSFATALVLRAALLLIAFLLSMLAPTPQASPALSATGLMYVVNSTGNTVSTADLTGAGGLSYSLSGQLKNPFGLALDLVHGKMYVTSYLTNTVSRATLAGVWESTFSVGGQLKSPMGIALDLTHGKMYVANYVGNTIVQADLNGDGATVLNTTGCTLSGPKDLAIDVLHGRLYVANFFGSSVLRVNLDGTGCRWLGTLGSLAQSPSGIALNLRDGLMYVTRGDASPSVIQANLLGGNAVSLGNFNGTLNWPEGIAVDLVNGKLYVANSMNNTISQADLNGGGGVSLGNLNNTLNVPRRIALDAVYPDIAATIVDNTSAAITVGRTFIWTFTVMNIGTAAASFAEGAAFLRDDLPLGAIYGTPTVTGTADVTNSGNLACSVDANKVLTCGATGAAVTLAAATGQIIVQVPVTPMTLGAFTNPRTGGQCLGDPANVVPEADGTNNYCRAGVMVSGSLLWLPLTRR